MKKSNARKISMIAAAVIVFIGCIVNTFRAYHVAVFWCEHCEYEKTVPTLLHYTVKNIPGEWFILDLDISMIFPLALIYLIVQLIFGLIRRRSAKRHSDAAAAEKSERKAGKVLFILSFLPFILFMGYCVVYAIGRSPVSEHIEFNRSSFAEAFVLTGLGLCMIPVFPAMLIYQIVYIVKTLRSKKGA